MRKALEVVEKSLYKMISSKVTVATSEKDRLRALVGLDNARMNSDFLLGTATVAGRTDVPESPELLSLLQKQDEIIAELHGELENCKSDLFLIKEQSAIQFEQNRRIFDELGAQIVKNNLGKDSGPSNQLVGAQTAGVITLQRRGSQFQLCANCREMSNAISTLERDKQKLQNRIIDCDGDLSQLRRQHAEHLRKIRESISLVEQAVFEKNEVTVQLKQAQNRVDALEKELRDVLSDHQSSMEQYRKSTQQRLEAEVESLKNQLNALIKSEIDLKSRLSVIAQERDDLQIDRTSAKQKSLEKRKEIEEKLKNLLSENSKLIRDNKDLKEALHETEQSMKSQNFELSERTQNLERQLSECRSNLESNKATLNSTKKENLDFRERCVVLEKETWQLRQWRQKLEREQEEILKNKDLESKEAVRIAELKHEQTKMELERLLSNQNGLIFKLKEECKVLADQLERSERNKKNVRKSQREYGDGFIEHS